MRVCDLGRVLALGAHPDDVELGCGGLLQRAEECRVLVASAGERGGDPGVRLAEAHASAAVLGAELIVLRHQDTRVDPVVLTADVERVLAEFRPALVLVTPANDPHQDHAAVHQAAVRAVRDHPCQLLAYVTPSAAPAFGPDWFASLTQEQLDRKLQAVRMHASQRRSHQYLADEYIVGMARYWAMVTRAQAQYVEPFRLVSYREAA